jgi:dynein intermediate chain
VNKRRARLQIRRYASLFYAPNLLSSALQLLTRGSPSSRTKSPDPLSKERDDVNKLVSDLIGGSPLATKPSSTPSVLAKSPGEVAASPAAGTPVSACKRKTKLVMEALAPVVIRPKEVEVYVKSTQTDMVSMEPQRNDDEDEDELVVEVVSAPAATEPDKVKVQTHPLCMEISAEQRDKIVASDEFLTFFDRASRLVERALTKPSDILFDYVSGSGEDGRDALGSLKAVKKKVFVDERWSQSRIVTAMDWSSYHPELLLVSYFTNPNIPHDPDGVVLMWDLKFQKDTPDYIFNCQSAVMSVAFSRFHPSYIIGGTYSGQLVLWDIRIGKRTPVQRSPLSSSSHTHPVYCLDVVGTENAHNLISASNDGRLCSWNLDNLSQPQESLELASRGAKQVAVTSLSFPSNDVNKFIVGSQECAAYQGQRHGSKPGLAVQFDGHHGPVTAVSCHRATGGQTDLSHLFLTSSFDWTVKLWSTKLQNEQQLTSKTGSPLCSFENNSDYVYDVQWSPTHPAVFASVDGEGRLDFWNINTDIEVPTLTENLDACLSKLHWAPNGHYVAVGDCEGKVHIFEAGEALYSPAPDESARVQATLLDLQEAQDSSMTVL